ncbi:MAG: type II toxin-antitoxin system HicA family toxin [Clostridiales bacterium]|jgi:predicted RNA binding protein YcfA (HicA-like mRNA interferase family)|nr:type II toxin-antitoxin system HicA family toxin [Clostridiales bacterium]
MKGYAKAVRKILKKNGCYYKRNSRGDHEVWFSPITNRNVVVDNGMNSRLTANGILKDAGIDYRF